VIDPYNEIEQRRPPNMTETEYVSQLLGKVRRFAQHYGVHVWFVAHPAKMQRDGTGSRPVPTCMTSAGPQIGSTRRISGSSSTATSTRTRRCRRSRCAKSGLNLWAK